MSSVLMPRFALSTESQGSPHLAHNPNWLLGDIPTPLKNMSQMGWWNSQLNGKIKFMFQTTNQLNECLFICAWFCWGTQLLSAGKNPHYVAILQAKVQHSVVIFLQNENNTKKTQYAALIISYISGTSLTTMWFSTLGDKPSSFFL